MCSISGIINYQKNAVENSNIIHTMNESMKHRGPDASGVCCVQNAALGHRRLSIVDLAGGIQPMSISHMGKTCVMVYNGELYNTDEIRKKLQSLNHRFTTSSDTEVLLRAYIEWDYDCLEHLNGIFAFGIFDCKKNELFCARDHFGVKPFFYTITNNEFIFGSEIKSLLKHPNVKPIIKETGLCELFGLSPARTPGVGIFDSIHELKRSHYLIYNNSGIHQHKYWHIKAKEHTENAIDTIAHVNELVTDSINRQLVSDVELGCFLSGGLDSSAISAIAAKDAINNGRILNTFSVDYQDNIKNFVPSQFQPNPDSDWIDIVSNHINSNHIDIVLDHNDLQSSLHEAMCARDLPGMADIDSSLLLFCRKVRSHMSVALSGECADEIFGGYPWYHNINLYDEGLFPWGGNIEFRQSFINQSIISKLPIYDYVRNSYDECVNSAQLLDTDTEKEISMRKMFMLNIDYFMANLLERKDRMSMASGLEVRVPFCDYRLVEYAYNIPWEIKSYENREKGVLRQAVSTLLPPEVVNRKKSPYPKTFDPKYTQAILTMFNHDVINSNNAPLLDLFDKNKLIQLCSNPNPAKPFFGQLMSTPQLIAYLWQINAWLKEYNVNIVGI